MLDAPAPAPAAKPRRQPQQMSARDFRAFQDGRPDQERWELIDGVPVMMTPPFLDHNRIASNLERVLNDALEVHDPTREAVQRPGVELGLGADVLTGLGREAEYRPEPDVAVIAHDPRPGRRFVDRAFLLAEIVSGTDDDPVAAAGEPWIAVKSRLYRAHSACEYVLIVEQRRIEVRIAARTDAGWIDRTLSDAADALVLPSFGFRCTVGDLYAGTHLRPRPVREP